MPRKNQFGNTLRNQNIIIGVIIIIIILYFLYRKSKSSFVVPDTFENQTPSSSKSYEYIKETTFYSGKSALYPIGYKNFKYYDNNWRFQFADIGSFTGQLRVASFGSGSNSVPGTESFNQPGNYCKLFSSGHIFLFDKNGRALWANSSTVMNLINSINNEVTKKLSDCSTKIMTKPTCLFDSTKRLSQISVETLTTYANSTSILGTPITNQVGKDEIFIHYATNNGIFRTVQLLNIAGTYKIYNKCKKTTYSRYAPGQIVYSINGSEIGKYITDIDGNLETVGNTPITNSILSIPNNLPTGNGELSQNICCNPIKQAEARGEITVPGLLPWPLDSPDYYKACTDTVINSANHTIFTDRYGAFDKFLPGSNVMKTDANGNKYIDIPFNYKTAAENAALWWSTNVMYKKKKK